MSCTSRPQQVADAVREEQGVGASLDQAVDVAAEDALVDQAPGQRPARLQVHVAVAHPGPHAVDGVDVGL
jgi:hypothetical protein